MQRVTDTYEVCQNADEFRHYVEVRTGRSTTDWQILHCSVEEDSSH
eukprot:COSAG02_NODE_3652_length_6414_cov_10.240222_6_plen_46_part_00